MKSLQDRIWLILVGVAVAILVTVTTVFWSGPAPASPGSESGVTKPARSRTLLPRIGSEFSRHLIKPLIQSR